MSMFDDEPSNVGTERLTPAECLGHLLMVWATGYIEDSPTKFSTTGKQSDVIVVDVVDLDLADEDGYQGKVFRGSWWRNGRLIGDLKPRIGREKPYLARMIQGEATMGFPPYELQLAAGDSDAVGRASAWLEAHPDFRPTASYKRAAPTEVVTPSAPVARLKSALELAAERAASRPVPPPPPPQRNVYEEKPPF